MKKPNPDKMFKTFRSIAGYLILIIIIFLLFDKQSDRTDELIKRLETQEKALKRQSESLLTVLEANHEKTLQFIKDNKVKETKIYNNYYKNEQNYINIDSLDAAVIEYLSNYRFQRFEITE